MREKEKRDYQTRLTEQDYHGVIYDEGTAEELSAEIILLEEMRKKWQKKSVKAAGIAGAAEEACRIALEEIQKLGAETPLSQEDIKGDFQERRHQLSTLQAKLTQEIELIS